MITGSRFGLVLEDGRKSLLRRFAGVISFSFVVVLPLYGRVTLCGVTFSLSFCALFVIFNFALALSGLTGSGNTVVSNV